MVDSVCLTSCRPCWHSRRSWSTSWFKMLSVLLQCDRIRWSTCCRDNMSSLKVASILLSESFTRCSSEWRQLSAFDRSWESFDWTWETEWVGHRQTWPIGFASDDVTKQRNAWHRGKLKIASHTKACWEKSLYIGRSSLRSERFWQFLYSLVRHIEIYGGGGGGQTSAGPFFGRLTIFQDAFVWDAVFVKNQFCRLLRPLLRCDIVLASPMKWHYPHHTYSNQGKSQLLDLNESPLHDH